MKTWQVVANKLLKEKTVKKYMLLILAALLSSGASADDSTKPPKVSDYASSTGQSIGDIVTTRTDAYGFVAVTTTEDANSFYCAGALSNIRVNGRNSSYTFVEFKDEKSIKTPIAGTVVCPASAKKPLPGVTFRISNDQWDRIRKHSSGWAFGALVVPFKFRLGSDSKLVSSSTIAPYIGFRFPELQGGSMELIPFVSVGLGLVPVADPATNKTQTKTGLSTAVGFLVTSEKSQSFSAGFLLGKDFLDREDQKIDPTVKKAWVSIWLGVPLN